MGRKPKGEGTSKTGAKVLREIFRMIDAAPFAALAELNRRSSGIDKTEPAGVWQKAGEAVDLMHLEALLGNEDAVLALRDLGVKIAVTLHSLLGITKDSVSDLIDDAGTFPEDRFGASLRIPETGHVIKALLNFFRVGVKALAEEEEVGLRKISDVLATRGAADVDVIKGLLDGAEFSESSRLAASIVSQYLLLRTRVVSRRVARRVVMSSPGWPIVALAAEEGRQEAMESYVRALGIGIAMDVQFQRKSDKGRPRDFDPESQTGFALKVYLNLEFERKPLTDKFSFFWVRLDSDTDSSWDERWKETAKRLPNFSSEGGVIAAWVTAGMQWAEAQCEGDWEKFPCPECVKKRVGKDPTAENPKFWTVEKALKEKLSRGMRSLAKRQRDKEAKSRSE